MSQIKIPCIRFLFTLQRYKCSDCNCSFALVKSRKKVDFRFPNSPFWCLVKVIHTKYSKHRPSTVAHTFECVCSKKNHGLNHGLFILLLKLINCPIH